MERFAETFLDWNVMAQYAPKILEGAWVTIQIAAAVVVAGIASGLALAVLRAFRLRLIHLPGSECLRIQVDPRPAHFGHVAALAAQMSGTGTVHPTSGDTYTVTYTTGGQSFTVSGTF